MKHILLGLLLLASLVKAEQYPAPTGVHETKVTDTEVTIEWNKAASANGYAVYEMGATNTQLAVIDNPEKTSYIVTSLDPYTHYDFAVKAGYYVNGRVEESDFSEQVNVRTIHTWSDWLQQCLPPSAIPVTKSSLLTIDIFTCIAADANEDHVDMGALVDLKNVVELDAHDNVHSYLSSWDSLFGELTALKKLNLNNMGSAYYGQSMYIPDNIIDQATQLEELQLANFDLRGNIPDTIVNLTHLKTLNLSVNYLMNAIPDTIGNMINLEVLNLYHNDLNASIPTTIKNLTNLKVLNLGNNRLTGNIPTEIGLLENNLTGLFVGHNGLSGTIPSEIGNLKNLKSLSLANNYLGGTIPDSLSLLSSLEYLYLNDNRLIGTIPVVLAAMKKLRLFDLSSNNLEGVIPYQMGEMTWLGTIYLSHNHFEGVIPENIFDLVHLLTFEVDNNNLSGPVSENITQRDFTSLRLYDNCDLYSNDPVVQNFIDDKSEEHDGVAGYQYILNTNSKNCFNPARIVPIITYILE